AQPRQAHRSARVSATDIDDDISDSNGHDTPSVSPEPLRPGPATTANPNAKNAARFYSLFPCCRASSKHPLFRTSRGPGHKRTKRVLDVRVGPPPASNSDRPNNRNSEAQSR